MRATNIGVGLSVALHVMLGVSLVAMRHSWPRAPAGTPLFLDLESPREALRPLYMVASMPVPASATPTPAPPASAMPTPADPAETPRPPKPPETELLLGEADRADLEAERQRLTAELQQKRQDALSEIDEQLQKASRTMQAPKLKVAAGSLGTVRELDLKGWPQDVIERIMKKYELRITERYAPGSSNQSFLSSAATAAGGRYYASRGGRPGHYQVFELSREVVAHMSRLEEAEIRRRNLDLERTRVASVTFGIVQTSPDQYDIGILTFQAEQIP
jgi:hypothetical protein